MATKATRTTINTFEDVNAKLLEYAKHKAYNEKLEATMNEEIQSIKDKYDALTKYRREQCISIEADVKSFCENNKSTFEKKRTKKLLFGKVGFRTATQSLIPLNKKYKWKNILVLLKETWKKKFVRLVEETDKELLLRKYREGTINDQDLARVGLRVKQDEGFVFEIDWKSIEQN